jgi:diguanylate cyclase (GGDEF)-like protein
MNERDSSNPKRLLSGVPADDHTLFTTRGTSALDTSGLRSFHQQPALLVQRGPVVGAWFRFPDDVDVVVVGRGEEATFQVKDVSVSREHARFTLVRVDGAPLEARVEDLDSTNGTRVGGKQVTRPTLITDGDLIRLGDVVLRFRVMDSADVDFQEAMSRQVRNARKDTLTGLYSRRFMDEQLPGLMESHRRNRHPMSLLIIDLDHFKAINDTHGHLVGDEVLRQVAGAMQSAVRGDDMAIRYGGEEFCILLPGSDADQAFLIGERIRTAIAELDFNHLDADLKVTTSGGVACLGDREELEEWLQRADLALYSAKHAGRNQIHMAREAPPNSADEPVPSPQPLAALPRSQARGRRKT